MKKPIYKKWWFWLIIVVLVVAIGSSAGGDDTTVDNDTSDATVNNNEETTINNEQSVEKKTSFALNETYTDSIQSITVTAVEEYNGYSQYTKPTEGNIVIRAYVKFKNLSSSSDNYVYSGDFDCYANNKVCSKFIWHEDKNDLVSGNLTPGRETEGWIYFEVPANSTSIELEYEVSIWGPSVIKFILL